MAKQTDINSILNDIENRKDDHTQSDIRDQFYHRNMKLLRFEEYLLILFNFSIRVIRFLFKIITLKKFKEMRERNQSTDNNDAAVSDQPYIVIVVPSFSKNDAVSNDALIQYQELEKNQYNVLFYTETNNHTIDLKYISKSLLSELLKDEKNIIIYHHCIFWPFATTMINGARARIIIKYHNVTPYYFFSKYCKKEMINTKKGRIQLQKIINAGNITEFMCASKFNADEILDNGASENIVSVVAPYIKITDFNSTKINSKLLPSLSKETINLIFVGRVVPNKGHWHLIKTVNAYVNLFDKNIKLYIIGSVPKSAVMYKRALKRITTRYGLQKNIEFCDKISFSDLHTYYSYSDIFLVMSEHEGFCVPIIEAQYHNLPVIGINRGAIKNTAGPEQLIFDEFNYSKIAEAINHIHTNKQARDYLVKKGKENITRYEPEALTKKLISRLKIITRS